MAEWTPRFGSGVQPLSANDIGRQGLPLYQPVITSPTSTSSFRSRFMSEAQPERPFSEVGKMSVNLGSLGKTAESAQKTQGLVPGLLSGGGRLVGGIFGKEAGQTGADIGEFLGGIAQVPMDAAANVLGSIPGPFNRQAGLSLLDKSDEEKARLMESWDGNPFTLTRHLQDLDKQDWMQKTETGEINPLFRDLGPAYSLGDQVLFGLNVFGKGSALAQRTLGNIGGGQGTIDRIMNAPEGDLNEEVKALKERYLAGTIDKDQFLDEIVMANAGASNNWALNLAMSMVGDPVLLMSGGLGAVAKAAVGARMMSATKFVGMIGDEAYGKLVSTVEATALKEGKAVTNEMVLAEAKRQGIHGDAIAEATKQMGLKDRWVMEYAEPLEPIYKVVNTISDPIKMIGRRGSQPMKNAWLDAQSTHAVGEAYGTKNFRHVQYALAKLGKRDIFDSAMGYFTAQEGMFMQGHLLAEDVKRLRNVVDAHPSEVAKARLEAGSQNYFRTLEAFVSRRKVDLARPTGLDTAEQSLARAQGETTTKLMKMAGISEGEATDIIKGLDADGLSMIDAAYFGHRIKAYNAAMRASRETLANQIAKGMANKAKAGTTTTREKAMKLLDQTTMIGNREITSARSVTLRADLGNADIHAAAEAGRSAIRRYDRLGEVMIADGTSDAEVVASVLKWLDDWDDTLTKELTPNQVKSLPKEMQDFLDAEDDYVLGLKPEGDGAWRIKTDPDDPNKITSANPWMDIVGDQANPWMTKFNGDSKVGNMANALDRAVGALSHQITTDRIFGEARRDFMHKAMNGYAPGQKTALTGEQADELWKGVLNKARDIGTTPRGMHLSEYEELLSRMPHVLEAGISARDVMGMSLAAFEGRLGTVGVTQKATGAAKRLYGQGTGMNGLGVMAERMYPMVRFAINPFFQLQEWLEPWVFAAARGKTARLAGGWFDPVTGVKVTADEAALQQKYLIDRYAAANPYAQFDQMERSLVYVYGSKATKDAARVVDGGRMAAARDQVAKIKTTGDRKAVAQSKMFRTFIGPILHGQFDSIDPRAWADLERIYGTTDEGLIAVRWLMEKDVWAEADPKFAHYATDAAKARYVGQTAPVNLDAVATHSFKTTRGAMVLEAKAGTLTRDLFEEKMTAIGAHPEYISRSWKTLQLNVREGGVDGFWESGTRSKTNPLGRPKAEMAQVRAYVKVLADVHGVSEEEYIANNLTDHFMTIMHDDLMTAIETDLAGLTTLYQQAKFAKDNWFASDPVTGAIIHQTLDPAEAEARFLAGANDPPRRLVEAGQGGMLPIEKVAFGSGRTLFVPGGEAALRDLETPFSPWEAHIIRNQLVDPNDLLDDDLAHALYEKMWRAHTIDMANPELVHQTFNNLVMAMLSAGLNLTRNELIATRFRVTSVADLEELAATTDELRRVIKATLPDGEEVRANDLGLAYSTSPRVRNYIGLDAMDDAASESFRPEAQKVMGQRQRQAKGYLEEADRTLHAKTMLAASQRDAVAEMTSRAEKKVESATEALKKITDEGGDPDQIAKAQQKLDDAITSRDSIDPDQALKDLEESDQAALDALDEEEIAKIEKRSEKAVGRISEWAVDRAAKLIDEGRISDLKAVLDAEYGVPAAIMKDPAQWGRYTEAAAKLAESKGEDLAARDVIRELVPGAAKVDQAIVWKKWNVNGAGAPHLKTDDGNISGHGDADIFAYLKNEDVNWRGFSTNAGMGNVMLMAEDMAKNPGHYVRRTGPEFSTPIGHTATGEDFVTWQRNQTVRGKFTEWVPLSYFDDLPHGNPTSADHVAQLRLSIQRQGFLEPLPLEYSQEGKTIHMTEGNHRIEAAREAGLEAVPVTFGRYLRPGPEKTSKAVRGAVENEDGYVPGNLRPSDIGVPTVPEPVGVQKFVTEEGVWDVNGRYLGPPVDHTGAFAKREATGAAQAAQEPLDQFAERISHRTRGLSLKTGYFGVDLGNPMEFNRGVMDTHMVGDLTEWLYHDVTKQGTEGTRWQDFMASLTPAKRKQVQAWIDRKKTRVDEVGADGKKTGKKVEVPYPAGAPRGAGVYDWSEAIGKSLSIKPPKGTPVPDSVASRAEYVRTRITQSKLSDAEKARLFGMYRTDEELAEMYGRDIKVLGGDYEIYDNLMAERKAIEEQTNPNIARYGHGGYQWKLWDERRKVYDPEVHAFAGTHGIKPQDTAILAASDDMHYASGFMDKGGLRNIADAGYRYLDLGPTIMAQSQHGLIRGATVFVEDAEALIAITEHANASTIMHELAHSLLRKSLDPSGRQVVLDDLNEFRRVADEKLVQDLDEARVELVRLEDEVRTVEGVLVDAETAAKTATTEAKAKVTAATKSEAAAEKLKVRAAEQRGKVKTLSDTIQSRKKAINASKSAPSIKKRQLDALDVRLAKETKTLDTLTAQHLAAEAEYPGLWDEANAAQDLARSNAEDVNIIKSRLRDARKEGDAAKVKHDELASTSPQGPIDVWDIAADEHFAEQFEVWLRTGKTKNPAMRDVMAYFHRVLQKLEDFVKGNPQIKVSPAMQELFDKLHTPQTTRAAHFANPIPFNATQETMHASGRIAVLDAEDAAHTNVQFRRQRSVTERSFNHPYFGVYPASYMWGKVLPEMVRALSLNPFGIPIPGMMEGATPGMGFVNAQRVYNAVEMQKDSDPEFRKTMNDPKNDKFFRGLAMLVPATPWDIPANFPLYTRRLAEWGLESQERVATGRTPKGFDVPKVASDVTSYAFGPAASLDWLADITKWKDAPILGGDENENGLNAGDLVVGGGKTQTMEEILAAAGGQLQNSLGQ